MRLLAGVCLLLLVLPASARMYQWTDPDSGRTHLSGHAPPWYRGAGDGPRVFVFERGRLVDDTARQVSPETRRQLREQALDSGDSGRNGPRQQQVAAPQGVRDGQADDVLSPIPPVPGTDNALEAVGQQPAAGASMVEGLSAAEVQLMRQRIAEWEARNQQRARELLGTEEMPPPSVSPEADMISREALLDILQGRQNERQDRD